MWDDLLLAAALVMILEGVFPFLSPGRFRAALLQLARFDDRTLRIAGLVSMVIGLIVLNGVK